MSVSVLLGQSPLSFHLIAPRALSITTSPWFMYLRYTFAKGFPLVLPLQLQPHQCPPRVRTIVFLFSKFHSIHFRAAHCPSLPTISIQSSLHPNPNPLPLAPTALSWSMLSTSRLKREIASFATVTRTAW
ncbi:hypothetical protein K438DRAFT_1988019 [Mycena galopus ATCC 62051]|nr:hypothetical protein K438DRAFT_1988019 [Mycena galopus ATCC 62051]